MTVCTFDEVTSIDERVLVFTRLGRDPDPRQAVEASLQDWQEVLERIRFVDDVAEQTRSSFNDLRKAFIYGVFCYEIFTLVQDRALFVLEQALRDRFVELHAGTVTFVVDGTATDVPATDYGMVFDFLRRHKHRTVRLEVPGPRGVKRIRFNGMLDGLRAWARHRGLLAGQRTQVVEDVLTNMRNDAAHPAGYHLAMPMDTASTLSDLAEIINHLWGHKTPGGRLYPSPIDRDTIVIAWNPETTAVACGLAANISRGAEWADYSQFAIVQALWPGFGPDLYRYDSIYEVVNYPTSYLWGPGTHEEALHWLAAHPPHRDTANTSDRLFAVRHYQDRLYLPMRPDIAASQPPGHRGGHWHLVAADNPTNAFVHVRSLHRTDTKCTRAQVCPGCHARNIAEGNLSAVTGAAGPSARSTSRPPDFYVCGLGSGVRFVEL